MSRREPPTPECGRTQTHPHTRCQEVATYLTDFMDLSILPAGLLPGDSFLLRRKPSRFFMSLALSDREGRRGDGCVYKKEGKDGEGWNKDKQWVKDEKGGKTQGIKFVKSKAKVHIKKIQSMRIIG